MLQIAAPDEHVGRVLDHLFAHASDAGVAGLVGRLEPRLVVPLATRRCMLHTRAEILAMIHSRMPEITAAIRGGRALLTRLEGETWFGHWSESFGSEGAGVPRSVNAQWH